MDPLDIDCRTCGATAGRQCDLRAHAERRSVSIEQAIREAYQAGRRAQEDDWLEDVETEQEVVERLLAGVR